MEYFVYRNFTSENLFQGLDIQFSGYNDISEIPIANKYIWFYLPEIKIKTDEKNKKRFFSCFFSLVCFYILPCNQQSSNESS